MAVHVRSSKARCDDGYTIKPTYDAASVLVNFVSNKSPIHMSHVIISQCNGLHLAVFDVCKRWLMESKGVGK